MRLIDKDELKTAICIACSNGVIEIEGCASDDCTLQRLIDEQPTIKAEPVRHGKLLEGKTFNDQHCSVCGKRFRDDISFILPPDENGFPMPKRCPECGAYWDGKGSKANGCWITCNNCANTSCPNRDEEEGKSDGTG